MLQSKDLVLILLDMEARGIKGASEQLSKVITKNEVSLEALKFINDIRPLEVAEFYETLRKNHNKHKSPLYKNIVKDIEDPTEAISTLSAFALNLFLYSKHVEERNKQLFFKHVRAEEVTRVLNKYYTDYDVASALKMLRVLKADLIAFETIAGRR